MTAARWLLLAVGILLAGCQSRNDGAQTLHFWAMGREAEVVSALLPEFERTHPGIRVEVQQLAWTAAHEKLLTAVAGDSTPDLCQLGNTWIPELQALHALAPLQARTSHSLIQPADYFDGVWQTNLIGGVQYGVPWYVDTRLLFYRSDLLRAAGYATPATTWDGWLQQLQAIKRMVGPQRYAVLIPLNEFEELEILALQTPGTMLREQGQYGNFRSADFRRALSFYHLLFTQGLAPVATATQISNVWDEFGKGYYAFYISGPWNITEFKRRLPSSQQGNWMTAPMPGPDGPGASNAGGASLVLFARSKHQDAAWQLIEYLSQPQVQRQMFDLSGDLPPRRSAWTQGTLAEDPYIKAFRAQLERARAVPQVPEWEQIMQGMRLMTERVVRGTESEDAAVTRFDAEVDAMLAKRRWMLARKAPTS